VPKDNPFLTFAQAAINDRRAESKIASEALMDDVEYKGYVVSTRTVRLEVGGYMATATIGHPSQDTLITPFDTAVTKTAEEAAQIALQEAKNIIDARPEQDSDIAP